MKRILNKSHSDLPSKMKKTTNDKPSLNLGQPNVNKRIVFNEDETCTLTTNGSMKCLPTDSLVPEPEANDTSSEEESDEDAAPAVCSLKTSKAQTEADVLDEEKEQKLRKLKETKAKKDLRAKQHQRNLKQKLEKNERAKELEALMLDSSLVENTATLLEARQQAESSEDGYGSSDNDEDDLGTGFEGTRTVFDDDNMDELEDLFTPDAAAPKNGVHVVSLDTTGNDYKLQKALEFKNRMFFGESVRRMSNDSYKNSEDKRKAKQSVQVERNLRLAGQRM